MFIGFDYGTANCSVAVMENGQPRLLPLENSHTFIPSTLCAPTREAVSEYLWRHFGIQPGDTVGEQLLRRAVAYNREEDIIVEPGDLRFGRAALATYLEDPEEVYYVKSPKSFLGASGLHDNQIAFFEDLVCAMMANIKQQAEADLQQDITQAVIGRPVNFQGTGGDKANEQAESILRLAAKRAGFKAVQFQFEPVAAGLDYESTLNEDKTVLVVDIGGGTTDCSLIEMGRAGVTATNAKARCWRIPVVGLAVTISIFIWRLSRSCRCLVKGRRCNAASPCLSPSSGILSPSTTSSRNQTFMPAPTARCLNNWCVMPLNRKNWPVC